MLTSSTFALIDSRPTVLVQPTESVGLNTHKVSVRSHSMTHDTSEATVLVVDDDPAVVDVLAASLRMRGFAVYTATNGSAALAVARSVCPDIVICEVGLVGLDGVGVLRGLRADGIDSPVLILTSRCTVRDKIAGLRIGGDDYVTKPFSVDEVVCRARVILRRSRRSPQSLRTGHLTFADIELNERTQEVLKAGQPVALSPTEFKLLHYFMANADRVLSKPMILEQVWPGDFHGDVNVVGSYVSYLRRKIDAGDVRLLHTVRGVGYVLRQPRKLAD